jgi:hypothetical protein
MTAFDDDPDYEAQLKDVLGDQLSSWQETGDESTEQQEMGDFVKDTDDQSEDGVLDDAPSFRLKLPPESKLLHLKDEDTLSITGIGEDRALSEDARSISTGDDSPSAQVL